MHLSVTGNALAISQSPFTVVLVDVRKTERPIIMAHCFSRGHRPLTMLSSPNRYSALAARADEVIE
jgi:hypothetical protein